MPPPNTEPVRPPLLGKRYVIRRRLGRGGTSSVYLAFDLRLRAWRAAKVMHVESASDAELRERFVREAAAMAHLEHPNVARVFDVGTDATVPFLVMEWLEGGSAASWVMEHGAMQLELAIDVAMSACEALAFVHKHGVIHRDVNPRNLLFDRSGLCKLTDFGIAQLRDVLVPEDLGQHETQIGTVMGTEAYMAPEQKRDSSDVDLRVDIYGVGGSLYSLLTGKLPPDHAVAGRNDPRLRKVPPNVAAVLARACADQPRDRYASARELYDALAKIRAVGPRSDTKRMVSVRSEPIAASAPRTLTNEEYQSLTELIRSGACQGVYEPDAPVIKRGNPSRVSRLLLVPLLSVIAVGMTLGIGAASVLALVGARMAYEAEVALVRAEYRYESAAARHRDLVLSELTAAGIDTRELASAFDSLDVAGDAGRADAVLAVHHSLTAASKSLVETPPATRRTLEALAAAQTEHQRSRTHKEQLSRTLTVRLAALAGAAR